jgi:Fe-S cluster assembly protein SufB
MNRTTTRQTSSRSLSSSRDGSRGFSERVVREISEYKKEPRWMLEKRLKSLELYQSLDDPGFGVTTDSLNINTIVPYLRPEVQAARNWEDVPEEIRSTFDKLGIPEAERKALAGVGAQYDSEIVYQSIKRELESIGVVFLDMESAVREYPEIVKRYFMRAITPSDHKYAALHGAFWSGGSFVYVPEGVSVPLPLQAYFRMSMEGSGQFEHTLIIAEKGSSVEFVEGCSAPRFNEINLHVGMVELFVRDGARVKYSTIQNWSKNTLNLNSKRAIVGEDGTVEWVSGSLGSNKTMLYPASLLVGEGAKSEHLAITYAGKGQHMDTGAKVFHMAPGTSSVIDARSISINGGWAFYRGKLHIASNAKGSKANVKCTALMMDDNSRSDTVPVIEVKTRDADVGHEARIGRISDDQIYYLTTRGLSEDQAKALIVKGFAEPISKEFPLEYAVELNRLLNLELEGAIG